MLVAVACSGGNNEPKVVVGGALRARSKDKDGKHVGWKETKPEQMLESYQKHFEFKICPHSTCQVMQKFKIISWEV